MKDLMEIMITGMWTLIVQIRIRGLRIYSICNEICNYSLDNTENPSERNIIFGQESTLAQI